MENGVAVDPAPESALVDDDGAIDRMHESVARFGFAALPRSLRAEVLARLREEAGELFGGAVRADSAEGLRYGASVAKLGGHARALLNGKEMATLLERIFSGRFRLSEGISCCTFYASRDHLGAHRDSPAEQCEVTIILYLHAQSPSPDATDTGLVLNVYGEDAESVGDIRLRIPTMAGSLVLGRGSRYWHERPRLRPDEEVIAITGCYRSLD